MSAWNLSKAPLQAGPQSPSAAFRLGSRMSVAMGLQPCSVKKPQSMRRILVVDDHPDLLELLSMSFEAAGFSVITATNGAHALKRARELPDLILLDVVLPELDGFTVCQTLKKDRATASIPIIMMTGSPGQLNRFASQECGANDYLTKPFTPDELIARIRNLLDRSAGSPPAQQAEQRLKAQEVVP
jgi:two-component system, OmpR family, response regulator RpaA